MTQKEFVKRHNEWSQDREADELLSDILGCLNQAKKRLTVNVRGKAIYAETEPEHFVEDLLAKFLSMQFPEYFVVLESSRGTFVAGKNIAGVVKMRKNMNVVVKELA